jgi:hypothetical protein
MTRNLRIATDLPPAPQAYVIGNASCKAGARKREE